MHLPERITPAQLREKLALAGYKVTARQLRLWRARGLLPALRPQPRRGYRRGRGQAWRSPGLLAQAIALCELRTLKHPNDEARLLLFAMGFPVSPNKVRAAWQSRAGKTDQILEKRRRSIERNGMQIHDREDELSALAERDVKKISKITGLSRDLLIEPLIGVIGIAYHPNYKPDCEFSEFMFDAIRRLIVPSLFKEEPIISTTDFLSVLRFVQETMQHDVAKRTVAASSDATMRHAHRRWRRLLRLGVMLFPELVAGGRMVAAKSGRICLPAFFKWALDNELRKLDATMSIVEDFAANNDATEFVKAVLASKPADRRTATSLMALIRQLSRIWDHPGFPFSAHNPL